MTFVSDPSLFVHQLDVANDRVLLTRVPEADFRAASFLDQRLLQAAPGQQQRAAQWAEWGTIAAQTQGAREDARFIFHIGHVGSTLIARLLGEAADILALREPQLLRQFAELKALEGLAHAPWPPGRFGERLAIVRQWLSRSFRSEQRTLIKATSFASELAPELLDQVAPAMFLALSPERYIQTILAGENSRQELAVLSGTRLQRLNARLGGPAFKLWELDEAKRAAMAWACEMTALEAASRDNVLWCDFDAFLDAPAEELSRIAAHLEAQIPPDMALQLTNGPIMQRYSKAPEHGYSAQLREDVLAQAARERADEISQALEWLNQAGKAHPAIAAALDRA